MTRWPRALDHMKQDNTYLQKEKTKASSNFSSSRNNTTSDTVHTI